MLKTTGTLAAGAVLLALALPGSASAADNKRADGLTNATSQVTDISARHRRWHRRHVVRRHYRPRRFYSRRYYPRYYGGYYAYAPYPYYYRPYRYYRPGISFHFGF